jgi:hypothetical protein
MTTTAAALGHPADATALVPSAPLPAYGGPEMARALVAYRQLQEALDRAMPDQILELSGQKFRRKGYWRAVAAAFNLTVTCIREQRVEHDQDWGFETLYRATAPSGRSADGDGSCMASEKSKGRMTATLHNVKSHASTRGFNRAVANLVGFGEVSAEETADEIDPPRTISEKQRRRLFALAEEAGWTREAIASWLFERYGLRRTADIPMDTYDAICRVLEKPPGATP